MSLKFKIVSDLKIAYIRASGKITADEILIEGARLFTSSEWVNGFNILCDYREITEFDLKSKDVEKIVKQDKSNESLFNKSKCAIVADIDSVFGLSRMWEIHSENENNKIETMVFRNIEDSLRWFGMDVNVFQLIKDLP